MEPGGPGPLPLRRLSLCFLAEEMEQGFVSSRRPSLLRRVRWLCSAFAAGQCLVLLFQVARREEYARTAVGQQYFLFAVASSGALVLLELLLLLSTCCPRREAGPAALPARRQLLFEAAVIANMAVAMLAALLSSPRRFVKLRGQDLVAVFGSSYDSDSSLLLILDGFVTVSHLGLPIRWHVMAPLELLAMLLYVGNVTLIGTQEPSENVLMNVFVLTLLVAASAFSKRSAELDERRSFLRCINEKALRCEAEFQLSQVSASARRASEPGDAVESCDVLSSQHTEVTDRSGAVFDGPLGSSREERAAQLELVAAKGESEHWLIAASEVKLLGDGGLLGKGSFGQVQRGVFCGMLVAVKCPHLHNMRMRELCNELRVLRHLRHPHIVAAHGAVVMPAQGQVYLVLELIEGVSLTEFIVPRDPAQEGPPMLSRYQVMVGVSQALLYMHTRTPRIVHGDLKGTNVMVETSPGGRAFPKVLDFGLSRVVNAHTRALGGSLAWMAPEVIDRGPVRCSADIYSFGHVLAFAATGLPPMWNLGSRAAMLRALRSKPPEPTWPEQGSSAAFLGLKPLVTSCLQRQQHMRPRIPQVHRALLELGLSTPLQPAPAERCLHNLRLVASSMEPREPGEVVDDLPDLSVPTLKTGGSLASLPEEEEVLATQENTPPPPAPTAAAVCSPEIRPPACCPYPELPETCRASMQATLMAAFRRWNSAEVQGRACCELHAWFQLCQDVCAEGLASACANGPLRTALPKEARQCGYCGVLDVPDDRCELCGFRPARDRSSGSGGSSCESAESSALPVSL